LKLAQTKTALLILCAVLLFTTAFFSCSENKTPDTASANTVKGNLGKLQGKWQSMDDRASQIEIKDDKFTSYYNNEVMSTETIQFIKDTESRTPDPDGQYFIVMGQFDAMIYALVEVTDSKLEYSYTGRGNSLKYKKIQ